MHLLHLTVRVWGAVSLRNIANSGQVVLSQGPVVWIRRWWSVSWWPLTAGTSSSPTSHTGEVCVYVYVRLSVCEGGLEGEYMYVHVYARRSFRWLGGQITHPTTHLHLILPLGVQLASQTVLINLGKTSICSNLATL